MRRLLLVTASVAPLLLAAGVPAIAQPHFGGAGFRHGGGFHARGIGMRPFGARPAFPAYRQGWRGGWHGGGWRGAGYYRGYRGYPYWGSGLAAAATLGAIAAYPSYPVYPAYPIYPAYEALPAAAGGMCSTPVKTCTLYEPAPIGIGCSCRVPGGRARGTVVGP